MARIKRKKTITKNGDLSIITCHPYADDINDFIYFFVPTSMVEDFMTFIANPIFNYNVSDFDIMKGGCSNDCLS